MAHNNAFHADPCRLSVAALEALQKRFAEKTIEEPSCTFVRVIADNQHGVLERQYPADLMAFRPGFTDFLQLVLRELKIIVELCDYCLQVIPKRLQCTKCKTATYCSRNCQIEAWKKGHKKECILREVKRDCVWLDFNKVTVPGLYMLVQDKGLTAQELRLVRHCIGHSPPREARGQTARAIRIMLVKIVTASLVVAVGPFPTQRRRNACNMTELEYFLLMTLGALTGDREAWRLDPKCLPDDIRPFFRPATEHPPADQVVFHCPDAKILECLALDCCEEEQEAQRRSAFTDCWESVLFQFFRQPGTAGPQAVVRLDEPISWLEMLRHVLEQWRVGPHKDHTFASYIVLMMGENMHMLFDAYLKSNPLPRSRLFVLFENWHMVGGQRMPELLVLDPMHKPTDKARALQLRVAEARYLEESGAMELASPELCALWRARFEEAVQQMPVTPNGGRAISSTAPVILDIDKLDRWSQCGARALMLGQEKNEKHNQHMIRLLFLKPLHMMQWMQKFFNISSSLGYLRDDTRARRWTAWLQARCKTEFCFSGQKLQKELIFEGQLDVITKQTNEIGKLAQQCQISRLFVRRKQRKLDQKQQQLDKQQAAQLQQQQEHEAALQKMRQQIARLQAESRDDTDLECKVCLEVSGFGDRPWHRYTDCTCYSVCEPCFANASCRCLVCQPNS